ncbi:M42 family metallopeptidase [Candidatus Acetothermia bacterium]|nr:M42 family metallopeptidase [Candidatus Acetothermia bacterium]
METIQLMEKLSNAFGVAGFEHEVRTEIEKLVKPLSDETRVDALGNLIATRKGKDGFTLMLDAHMDEVGLIVSYVEERGFLRFATLGGWDARVLPAQVVQVQTRSGKKSTGVIGCLPPHVLKPEDREKPFKIEDLFIDIGAESIEEATGMGVRIGDPAVPFYPFTQLTENLIGGKAFDDRAGCAVMIRVLEALKNAKLDLTLVCNFAVAEEIGARGARTAAYQVKPDLALALEGTIGADVPGVAPARQPTGLGKGPAITIVDNSLVASRRVVEALEKLAEKTKMAYQYKLPIYGGTDAGGIHTTGAGVESGVLSVPCRYIHSQFSLMRLDDFEQTAKLATEFAQNSRAMLG